MQAPEIPMHEFCVFMFVLEYASGRSGMSVFASMAVPTRQILVIDLGSRLQDREALIDQGPRRIVPSGFGIVIHPNPEETRNPHERKPHDGPGRDLIRMGLVIVIIRTPFSLGHLSLPRSRLTGRNPQEPGVRLLARLV